MRPSLMAVMLVFFWAPATSAQSPTDKDEPIVVTGIPNGATVVEVDFDKIWKTCAECKRALKKLDRLAQAYRDELQVAGAFASGPTNCGMAAGSQVYAFQRSSADPLPSGGPTTRDVSAELCAARRQESSRATQEAMIAGYVVPEQAKMIGYSRSFLDQLTPYVVQATEDERKARGARASLIGKKGTKVAARNLTRIDVTTAVVRRLDQMDFTINLPEPTKSPARK